MAPKKLWIHIKKSIIGLDFICKHIISLYLINVLVLHYKYKQSIIIVWLYYPESTPLMTYCNMLLI